jgi:hypothetical protein
MERHGYAYYGAPGAPRLDDALEAGHELRLASRSVEGGLLVLDVVLELPARYEALGVRRAA